ncbi:MAG: sigma-70 family RNA polymerase sigma factor [Acidobacteria bacterium]|nr:sigma-70 family RNA polymerase sigma factor [Acidobacteriota bacterium]
MSEENTVEITEILKDWSAGSENAKDRLLPFVYAELKRQARMIMSRERSDHTLQPTALVHETFIRMAERSGIDWQDRHHFYAISSRLMRQILIDHARSHAARKRGGDQIKFSLDDIQISVDERAASLLALDEALKRLAELDERQASIVEMRFFGGMTLDEIAGTLKTSQRTVSREWETARLWLYRELQH